MVRAVSRPAGNQYLRVKPMDRIVAQADEPERRLKRSIGPLTLTAFGVAAIIGAGIFVVTGQAAATEAGPGIVLSYVLAGITSGLAALCYAELASTVPIAGSAYTYSYATLGEFIAWIIGWDLILEYGVGAAAVAAGWGGAFSDLLKAAFNITLPASISHPPFATESVPTTGVINLPAFLIILLITGLLVLGTSESARVNNTLVAVKLAIIVFFIVVGATHIHTVNWTNSFLPFGVSGVVSGASLIFFAYIGFDQITTAAEEARDPQRTLPIGILTSLGVCTVLYMLVAGVLTGMLPYGQLNNPSPVSHALLQVGLSSAATIVSIGIVAGLTTVLFVLLFGQSRILFSMSRDGLMPGVFSRVHPRFRTPWISNLIVGIVIALLAGLTPIEDLVKMVNIGTLSAFILVSLAVWRLRITQPDMPRGFRVPWVPVLPILSVIACFVLIAKLPPITWVRFVVWLAIGLIVYFLYSRQHSELGAEADRTA